MPALEEPVVGDGPVLEFPGIQLTQAVADDPDGLVDQSLHPDALQGIRGIARRDISQEALVIKRDFQQVGFMDRTGQDAHIHFRFPELVLDGAGEHFFRLEGQGRVLFSKMLEKAGNQDGRYRRDQGDSEVTGKHFLFRAGHLDNLVRVVQDDFGLVDHFPADLGRRHGMGFAVEQAHVQFFLHLLDHQTQSGLGEAAGLGRFPEVPILLYGNDIPQLLECHLFSRLIISMQR